MPKVRNPAAAFQGLIDRVTRGEGNAPAAARQAAFGAGAEGLPPVAVAFIEKVRRHAYKVTDEDIAALKAAGLHEDTIFELTIAAAVGTASRRLDVAMKVIDEAG